MHTPRRAMLALAAFATLAGCGALTAVSTASAPLDTYTLSALAPADDPPEGSLHLIVEMPTSGGALATDRILIKPTRFQAQYLPGARWSDPAPALLQTLLVNSLLNRGGFRLVAREAAGLMPDHTLMTEVQAFQAEITAPGAAQVRVTLRMTLIRESDRSIVASRLFSDTMPVSTDATLALVSGFDGVLQNVLTDAVNWVRRSIQPGQ